MAQKQDANTQERENLSKKKISRPVIICVILMVVVIILAAIIMRILTAKPEGPKDVVSGRGTVATRDNVEELISEANANADTAYTVSMNIDWNFEDGLSPSSNAYVENDVSNSRTVYFDLMLADTSEVVYSSPYIPVGSSLTGFSLDKKLDAGDYAVIVEYHLVDDDHQELSTVSVSATLHILN